MEKVLCALVCRCFGEDKRRQLLTSALGTAPKPSLYEEAEAWIGARKRGNPFRRLPAAEAKALRASFDALPHRPRLPAIARALYTTEGVLLGALGRQLQNEVNLLPLAKRYELVIELKRMGMTKSGSGSVTQWCSHLTQQGSWQGLTPLEMTYYAWMMITANVPFRKTGFFSALEKEALSAYLQTNYSVCMSFAEWFLETPKARIEYLLEDYKPLRRKDAFWEPENVLLIQGWSLAYGDGPAEIVDLEVIPGLIPADLTAVEHHLVVDSPLERGAIAGNRPTGTNLSPEDKRLTKSFIGSRAPLIPNGAAAKVIGISEHMVSTTYRDIGISPEQRQQRSAEAMQALLRRAKPHFRGTSWRTSDLVLAYCYGKEYCLTAEEMALQGVPFLKAEKEEIEREIQAAGLGTARARHGTKALLPYDLAAFYRAAIDCNGAVSIDSLGEAFGLDRATTGHYLARLGIEFEDFRQRSFWDCYPLAVRGARWTFLEVALAQFAKESFNWDEYTVRAALFPWATEAEVHQHLGLKLPLPHRYRTFPDYILLTPLERRAIRLVLAEYYGFFTVLQLKARFGISQTPLSDAATEMGLTPEHKARCAERMLEQLSIDAPEISLPGEHLLHLRMFTSDFGLSAQEVWPKLFGERPYEEKAAAARLHFVPKSNPDRSDMPLLTFKALKRYAETHFGEVPVSVLARGLNIAAQTTVHALFDTLGYSREKWDAVQRGTLYWKLLQAKRHRRIRQFLAA